MNYITVKDAAESRQCSTQAIHNAISAEKIDAVKYSPRNVLVLINAKWRRWAPDRDRQNRAREAAA